MSTFKALVVNKSDNEVEAEIKEIGLSDLPEGDLLIKVAYSSVNFKDALACIKDGNIVQNYPIIPGIDLAGTVVTSESGQFQPGDKIIVTGFGLGVSHFGGFSKYARVPAEWALKLPDGLTMREAMILGTAGLTAALSLFELQQNGIQPEDGPILVTGTSGGVGSIAAGIAAKLGYRVTASTGKPDMHEILLEAGVQQFLSREELLTDAKRALSKQQWAGAIDCVGGRTLSSILPSMRYGGVVAASGLTGGTELAMTVYPFIIRGVRLIGIDSVMVSKEKRAKIWELLASVYKPPMLERLSEEISLEQISERVGLMLKGRSRGRTVVKL
ncbi:YhdH/YhfP family quinone oxidoreductase [Paenibacillus harenae]|uniref:YhdH/YhfP family quinone oxidoreductase n=1 Tax=Paenibacillus harenae TaxID=306543 RepID=UPI000429E970|nr:YhdH/YhfP family quinone oxidoreductase [Paenibacillus harenae]